MKNIYLSVIFLFLGVNNIFSQKILTLEESINIALKESYTFKSSEIQVQNTIRGFEATKLRMLSKVTINLNPNYSQSLNSQFDPINYVYNYYNTDQTNLPGGIEITQPIIFTNGTLRLSGQLSRMNQMDKENNINKTNYLDARIQLTQPLFQTNSQKIALEKAEMNLEKTQVSYTRTQMDIVYNVTQYFYNLYRSSKQLEINEVDVRQREDSYATAVKKFQAGLIPEVNMLQLEVDLANAKNDMLQKRRQFDMQKNQFKVLIGLPLDENINVMLSNEKEYKIIDIDTNKAVDLAIENNIELRNWKYDRKIQEYSIDEVKQQGRIKAGLSASYGLNNITRNVAMDKTLFQDPLNTKYIGVNVSIPVLDWGANNLDVQSAEATLNSLELEHNNKIVQAKQEIMDLLNQIDLAKFRINIAKRGLEIANKSYEISSERYKSQQIRSDEMILEQQRLTNAKLNELNSIMDYNLALADLKRKTFYDFEKDIPVKIMNDIKIGD